MTVALAARHAHRTRWLIAGAAALAVIAFAVWAKVRVSHLDPATQATNPIIRWEYLFKRPETRTELWQRTTEHLQLTIVPMAAGFVLACLLSAVGLRFRWLLTPITIFAGFLYTIPSLALFGVLVTYTSNWTAAVVALTSYTLLILVRNIVAGIDGVPTAVTDAADGLGMSRVRRLFSVEVPLALPVILTGVRVATVTTVGLVGISAVIQLGGLGALIFTGYNSSYPTKMVIGAAGSVLLAIVLDVLIRLVERVATPWARRRVAR
ncbi:MAG: transporter permease [Acidimicrobiales bacterium]|nr:transporter permease [Acidimicrobiales bacterium]